MGFDFAGKAVYTAVWVAAVSLFMELLGFSTQKWVTAGGLGTVLLTLAGREVKYNFFYNVCCNGSFRSSFSCISLPIIVLNFI